MSLVATRALAAIAAVLVSVACSAPPPASPTPTSAASGAGSQATAITQPTAAPAQPTAAPQSQGSSLPQMMSGAQNATYHVVYQVSGQAAGEQVVYNKPPKYRMDVNMSGTTGSMYNLPEGTFTCANQGGQAMCFGGPAMAGMVPQGQSPEELQRQVTSNQYATTQSGSRQIAGQQATCFTMKPTAAAGSNVSESSVCVNAQGVSLFMETVAQAGKITYEAKSYSPNVDDSVFTLPAPVMQIPAGAAGQMPPMPGR